MTYTGRKNKKWGRIGASIRLGSVAWNQFFGGEIFGGRVGKTVGRKVEAKKFGKWLWESLLLWDRGVGDKRYTAKLPFGFG